MAEVIENIQKWAAENAYDSVVAPLMARASGSLSNALTLCATGALAVTTGSCVHQGTGLASRQARAFGPSALALP
jgi:hypothetical protein